MALASAVGRSVEELFAAPPAAAPVPVFGPVADGGGVLAARVGARLVYAPAREALAVEGWPRANAVMRDGQPEPLPGSDLDGLVLVGCDPALRLAAAMLPSSGPAPPRGAVGATAPRSQPCATAARTPRSCTAPRAGCPPRRRARCASTSSRWRVGVTHPRPAPAPARRARARRAARGGRLKPPRRRCAAALAAEGAPLPPRPDRLRAPRRRPPRRLRRHRPA